jgi:hypothetical protein
LLLDYDDRKNPIQHWNEVAIRFTVLERFFRITERTITTKQSKHGIHVRIAFKSELKISDFDLVFMQLILMSDWKREVFNWKRVRSGLKKWNVLFKRKYNNKMEVVSHEAS